MDIIKKFLSVIISICCVANMTACSSNDTSSNSSSQTEPAGNPQDSGDNSSSDTGSASQDSQNSQTSQASQTESSEPGSASVIGAEGEGNIGETALKDGDIIAQIEIEGFGTIKAKLFPEISPVGVDNFVKLAQSGFYNGKTIHRVVKDFMFQGGSENGDGTGGEALTEGGSFGIEPNYNARHFYGALCYANAMGSNTTQFYIVNRSASQDLSAMDTNSIAVYADYFGQLKNSFEDKTSLEYLYYESMEKNYKNLLEMLEHADDATKAKYLEQGGTPELDGGYTVFGQVYEGFDVIEAISSVEVEENAGGEISKPVDEIKIVSVTTSEYKS